MAQYFISLVFLVYININQCYGNYTDTGSDSKELLKTCVPKCCPEGYVIGKRKTCNPYDGENVNFSDIKVYDADATYVVSTAKESFHLVPNKFSNKMFQLQAIDLTLLDKVNLYLTETGIIYLEQPNAYLRWTAISADNFCIDYIVKRNRKPVPSLWINHEITSLSDPHYMGNGFTPYALLVSCCFLLLVFVTYPLNAQNRDMLGFTVMVFILSYFKAFCLLCAMSFNVLLAKVCVALTKSTYFFYLSTYCWLGVLSFQQWCIFSKSFGTYWTTRSKWIIVVVYCLYSWSIPTFMTYGFSVMNSIDLKHMPWIIKPNVPLMGCFLGGGEKVLYLLVPSMILLLSCIVFEILTAQHFKQLYINAKKSQRSNNCVEASKPPTRFLANVMTTAVMLFHCSLEIANSLSQSHSLSIICDICNGLIGLSLFLILIVYPKISSYCHKARHNHLAVSYKA